MLCSSVTLILTGVVTENVHLYRTCACVKQTCCVQNICLCTEDVPVYKMLVYLRCVEFRTHACVQSTCLCTEDLLLFRRRVSAQGFEDGGCLLVELALIKYKMSTCIIFSHPNRLVI